MSRLLLVSPRHTEGVIYLRIQKTWSGACNPSRRDNVFDSSAKSPSPLERAGCTAGPTVGGKPEQEAIEPRGS